MPYTNVQTIPIIMISKLIVMTQILLHGMQELNNHKANEQCYNTMSRMTTVHLVFYLGPNHGTGRNRMRLGTSSALMHKFALRSVWAITPIFIE